MRNVLRSFPPLYRRYRAIRFNKYMIKRWVEYICYHNNEDGIEYSDFLVKYTRSKTDHETVFEVIYSSGIILCKFGRTYEHWGDSTEFYIFHVGEWCYDLYDLYMATRHKVQKSREADNHMRFSQLEDL